MPKALNKELQAHFSTIAVGLDAVPRGAQFRGSNERDEGLLALAQEMQSAGKRLEEALRHDGVLPVGTSIRCGRPIGRWPTVYYVSFHDGVNSSRPSEGVYPVILLASDHRAIWTAIDLAASEAGAHPEAAASRSGRESLAESAREWSDRISSPEGWIVGPLPLGEGGQPLPRGTRGMGPNYEVASIVGHRAEVGSATDFTSLLSQSFEMIRSGVAMGHPTLADEVGEQEPTGASGAEIDSDRDLRERSQRQIMVRRGQTAFRNAQLERFERRCAITGSTLVGLLEAAHVRDYRGEAHNDPQNGLLLRADVHTLFDLYLLGVDPKTCTVRLQKPLLQSEYAEYEGMALRLPEGVELLPAALAWKWRGFVLHASE